MLLDHHLPAAIGRPLEMERSEAIAKLKQHEAELRRLGVEHLYLFGSTARGEAREDSDIDLSSSIIPRALSAFSS